MKFSKWLLRGSVFLYNFYKIVNHWILIRQNSINRYAFNSNFKLLAFFGSTGKAKTLIQIIDN